MTKTIDVSEDRQAFLGMGGHIDEDWAISRDACESYGTDPQYLFMGLWAFNKIRRAAPKLHVDIGGDIEMLTYLSQLVNVEHRDIRSCRTDGQGYSFLRDDITNLHIPDGSVNSLSCLHVAEHIGLGRYGDNLDPDGFKKACRELRRVLAKNGKLYFAVPTGPARVVFNAHRIIEPREVIDCLAGLSLVDLAFVDSRGAYYPLYAMSDMYRDSYGCGLFEFTK